jgi:hypothetical protein
MDKNLENYIAKPIDYYVNSNYTYKSKYYKYSSKNSTNSKDYKSLYIKYKMKYLNLKESNMNFIKQKSESFVNENGNKQKYLNMKKYSKLYIRINQIKSLKGGSESSSSGMSQQNPLPPLRLNSVPNYMRSLSDQSYAREDYLFTRFFNDEKIKSLELETMDLWNRLNNLIEVLRKYPDHPGSITLFMNMMRYLSENMANEALVKNIKQFYYYEIYRMFQRLKAFNHVEGKEIYLVLQNKFDDQTVFGPTKIIYQDLAQIAMRTGAELHIYHTMSHSDKSSLESMGAIVKNSLDDYIQYLDIINNIGTKEQKISFLYFSAHGGYVSKSKTDSSIFGHFSGSGSPPSNLSREFLLSIIESVKPIITLDCNIVLNSCYLGQTDFDEEGLESTASLISHTLNENVVIAARSAIASGSLIQEFYMDELTNRLVFYGNVKSSDHSFQNRLYAYCPEATHNEQLMDTLLQTFSPDVVTELLNKEDLDMFE